jgi:thiol-disulfide isomerase/thioredoxin
VKAALKVGLFLFLFVGSVHSQTRHLEDFINRIKLITSGELIYSNRWKPLFSEDTLTSLLKLRFCKIHFEGYERYYTSLEKQNRYGKDISFFDIRHSRKFSGLAKKEFYGKGESDEKHDYYPPFFDLSILYYWSIDSLSKVKSYDSLQEGRALKVFQNSERYLIDANTWQGNTQKYIFGIDSVPIYYLDVYENWGSTQYNEFQLLDYKINCYDSASFIKMMDDSIASLSKQYPEKVDLDSLEDYHQNHPQEKTDNKEFLLAPNFETVSFAGNSVSFESVFDTNKLVLLDFWYNSCMPCQQAIPKLVSLYKKYHDQGLEILGINPFDTNRIATKKTIDRYGINYPIVLAKPSLAEQYGVHGYPTLFLIDKNKKILFAQEGFSEDIEEELEKIIEKQLH